MNGSFIDVIHALISRRLLNLKHFVVAIEDQSMSETFHSSLLFNSQLTVTYLPEFRHGILCKKTKLTGFRVAVYSTISTRITNVTDRHTDTQTDRIPITGRYCKRGKNRRVNSRLKTLLLQRAASALQAL